MLALAAALLLLWCHALDSSFHADVVTGQPDVAATADMTLASAVPAHHDLSDASCCFGTVGSSLLSVSVTRVPALAVPLQAAVPPSALHAVPPHPQSNPRYRALQRTSLVDQAVLIRI